MAQEQKIVFLLGAGFSKVVTPNKSAPLTDELGGRLKWIFPQEIEDKYGFSQKNIELFLTKVDLELSENNDGKLAGFRDNLIKKILEIFATKALGKVNQSDGKIEISDVADRIADILFKKGDTILTINYDCYLENVLLKKNKWSPNKGWGDIFMFPIDIYPKSEIEIFKLHGSINFILVAQLDKDGSFNEGKLVLNHIFNNECFPGYHAESRWEGTIREYIVLPSYLKQFEYKGMLRLWKNAALKIREADKLIVIGASLREEDYPIKFLISLINENAKIIIIDKNANSIKNKLVRYVPVNPDNIKPIEQKIEDITEDQADEIYKHV